MVTGAAGFVGRHVVTELLGQGHSVVAVVRPSRHLPCELEAPGVCVARLDLRAPGERLDELVGGVDAIVNLAATTSGSSRARFDGTVLATERLLDAIRARRWPGRLVHISSLAV